MLLKLSFWSGNFWKPDLLLRESTISSHFWKSHSLAVKALSFWLWCFQLEVCTLTTNHPPVQEKFPSHGSSLVAVVQVFSPDHLQQRMDSLCMHTQQVIWLQMLPLASHKKMIGELMGRNRQGEVGDILQCFLFVCYFATRVPCEGRWQEDVCVFENLVSWLAIIWQY